MHCVCEQVAGRSVCAEGGGDRGGSGCANITARDTLSVISLLYVYFILFICTGLHRQGAQKRRTSIRVGRALEVGEGLTSNWREDLV